MTGGSSANPASGPSAPAGPGSCGRERALDRIAGRARLEAGWLDGQGEPVSREAIARGRCEVDRPGEAARRCSPFPTPEGGLQSEASAAPFDELPIGPDGSPSLPPGLDTHEEHAR
jgi:hypothetical protein